MAVGEIVNSPDSGKVKEAAERKERKAARKVIARNEAYEKKAKKAAAKAERRATQKEIDKTNATAKLERKAVKSSQNPKVVDPHKATKALDRLLTRAVKFETRAQRMLKEATRLREQHAAQVKKDEVSPVSPSPWLYRRLISPHPLAVLKQEIHKDNSSSDGSDSSDSDNDSDNDSDVSSDFSSYDGGVAIVDDTAGDVEMAFANAQLRAESEGLSGPPYDVTPEPAPEPAKEEKKSKSKKIKDKKKSKATEPAEAELDATEPLKTDKKSKKAKKQKNVEEKEEEANEAVQETPKDKRKRKRNADNQVEMTPAKSDKKEKKKGKSSTEEAAAAGNEGEQWNVSGLDGGAERQSKFLKLLGGGKKGGTPSGQRAGMTKLNINKVNADLEKQFNAGMHMKWDGGGPRRGLGA